jgi:lipopolysaccharide/colanic/teichoic acid biosynthesis glycosyltransferase
MLYKRVMDLCTAGLALVLVSPLLLIAAVLVRLTSPGPAIYRQARIGKHGRVFQCYKFRSLYLGADQDVTREKRMAEFIAGRQLSSNTKIVNEKFITPVGRILRKFSIDEFPQLWNVILGDMSIVGPRPLLPYEYAEYKPWHHERNAVLPGCTGLWQACGRSRTTFDDMVAMDIRYVRHASLRLDLWIVLKTIPVLLLGRGGG